MTERERLEGFIARFSPQIAQLARSALLADAKTLVEADVSALIDLAIDEAGEPFASAPRGKVIVKAVSSRQRSRRPLDQS